MRIFSFIALLFGLAACSHAPTQSPPSPITYDVRVLLLDENLVRNFGLDQHPGPDLLGQPFGPTLNLFQAQLLFDAIQVGKGNFMLEYPRIKASPTADQKFRLTNSQLIDAAEYHPPEPPPLEDAATVPSTRQTIVIPPEVSGSPPAPPAPDIGTITLSLAPGLSADPQSTTLQITVTSPTIAASSTSALLPNGSSLLVGPSRIANNLNLFVLVRPNPSAPPRPPWPANQPILPRPNRPTPL